MKKLLIIAILALILPACGSLKPSGEAKPQPIEHVDIPEFDEMGVYCASACHLPK